MHKATFPASLFLGLALFCGSASLHAFVSQPVPGGIAAIGIAPLAAAKPVIHYAGHRVTVIPYQGSWVALVGIPLDATPGQQSLQVTNPQSGEGFSSAFTVRGKHYKTQRLRIHDRNKVTPDEASSQRILAELKVQERLKNHFSAREANYDFIKPVSGRDSGRFGSRRIINGQQRSPHSGMDLAVPSGTPVRSTASGTVLYTGNLFFSGNVVYVDHGSGLISMYAHLSNIKVRPGQQLRQGEVLGLSGKTGRATGPHLHWSVYLNGEAVDPALLLQKIY
ncbi:MAG: peptidoglycan DD-metalloendopeptidase family protein [Thiothrix sp.]|nr:peptidoglycan DD-metalloendopeptidase family protein [Thiothrix sp.]HPQ96123.1 peptidoglycan DD-metalloendopeptidase family protein [Thiolinea sp.]